MGMISTGGLSALFMLPFWAAGGLVTKDTILEPATSTEFSIGEFAWEVHKRIAGKRIKTTEGATEDLDGAEVGVVAYVNGVPQYELRLVGREGVSSIGGG